MTSTIIITVLALAVLYVLLMQAAIATLDERSRRIVAQVGSRLQSRWEAIQTMAAGTPELLNDVNSLRTFGTYAASQINLQEKWQQEKADELLAHAAAPEGDQAMAEAIRNFRAYGSDTAQLRQHYNSLTKRYNQLLALFPTNLVAHALGRCRHEYLGEWYKPDGTLI
jgi:hypothetical protein